MNMETLWHRLRDAHLVEGDMPALQTAAGEYSWPIRILLGIAGWLAALFLFAFFGFGIDDLLEDEIGRLTVGIVLCLAAMPLFRARTTNEFLRQIALAVALAGQLLMWWAVYDLYDGNTIGAHFSLAVLELVLIVAMPNFLHRVIAAAAAGCFGYWALAGLGYPALAVALIALLFVVLWLNEARWLARAEVYEPVGVALALLLVLLSARFDPLAWFGGIHQPPPVWSAYLTMAIIGIVFLVAVFKLLQQAEVPAQSPIGLATLAGAVLLAILCARAPGLLPALLVLLIGFARGHRFIWVLGMLALIAYGSYYYYSLEYDLLVKSGVLAMTGAALLIARAAMQRLGGSHA